MKTFIRAAMLAAIPLTGCGGSSVVEPPYGSINNISISRADGSVIIFAPNVHAWCGPWEQGVVEEPTVHVIVGDATSRWELRVVRRDAAEGATLSFPNEFIWDQPRRADLFIHDPPNELSTQTSGTTGAVMIDRFDCGPAGGIRFTVDAVVASELANLPPVTISGHFVTPWTGRPGD
jgi:hypothetical protein